MAQGTLVAAVGGVVAGLLVGALAVGPLFLSASEPPTSTQGGQSGPSVSKADLAELERLRSEADKAAERYKSFEVAANQARQERDQLAATEAAARSEASGLAAKVSDLEAQLAAKDAELARASSTLEWAGLKPVSEEELAAMTAERIKENRAKGQTLVGKLEGLIETKAGKKEVLDTLRALADIGLDAAPEYFKAFQMVNALGGPYPGSQKNELELRWDEYVGLLPKEFAEFALNDRSGVAPVEAQGWAMYGVYWDSTKSTSQKVEILTSLMNTGHQELLGPGIQNLVMLKTPESVPHLSRAAANGGIDGGLRAQAIIGMADLGDHADWTTIESLQNDSDPRVAQAARVSLTLRNQSVDGFLVTGVTDGSSAAAAGMKVGDVIVRYNGHVVSDQATLLSARDRSGEELEVPIVVQRGNNEVTLKIKTGAIGIDGRTVSKR